MACNGLKRIVVAIAFPGRRHDDDTIDTGFVHHRQQFFDREWLRQLRRSARPPRPVCCCWLPEVNLRVDDHAFARTSLWSRSLLRSSRLCNSRQAESREQHADARCGTEKMPA